MIHKKRDEWAYTLCGQSITGLIISAEDTLVDCPTCCIYLDDAEEINFLNNDLINLDKEDRLLSRLLFGLFCGALALSVLLFLLSFEV